MTERIATATGIVGEIVIYKAGESWVADLARATGADDVRRAFGTTILPVAFSAAASAATVVRALRRCNPHDRILVLGCGPIERAAHELVAEKATRRQQQEGA